MSNKNYCFLHYLTFVDLMRGIVVRGTSYRVFYLLIAILVMKLVEGLRKQWSRHFDSTRDDSKVKDGHASYS